jgi:hypothetical protein
MSSKTQPPKNQHPNEEMETQIDRQFLKEEVQMANKYMKNCLTFLVIKEMQIKTTLRFHLTPVKIAIFKDKTTNVKQPPLYTFGGNVN